MWLKELLLHKGSVKMDVYHGMFWALDTLWTADPVVRHEAWPITKEYAVTWLKVA